MKMIDSHQLYMQIKSKHSNLASSICQSSPYFSSIQSYSGLKSQFVYCQDISYFHAKYQECCQLISFERCLAQLFDYSKAISLLYLHLSAYFESTLKYAPLNQPNFSILLPCQSPRFLRLSSREFILNLQAEIIQFFSIFMVISFLQVFFLSFSQFLSKMVNLLDFSNLLILIILFQLESRYLVVSIISKIMEDFLICCMGKPFHSFSGKILQHQAIEFNRLSKEDSLQDDVSHWLISMVVSKHFD